MAALLMTSMVWSGHAQEKDEMDLSGEWAFQTDVMAVSYTHLISVTHVALGTVRVMRTTGMMGEVVGMAASLCKKYNTCLLYTSGSIFYHFGIGGNKYGSTDTSIVELIQHFVQEVKKIGRAHV